MGVGGRCTSLLFEHHSLFLSTGDALEVVILSTMDPNSLAGATPVWNNRGLVTALHTTSSDGMQLADMVGRAAVAQLTQV